ncbi:MAG: ABC transporter substrate-binding protein [Thainema sp.]
MLVVTAKDICSMLRSHWWQRLCLLGITLWLTVACGSVSQPSGLGNSQSSPANCRPVNHAMGETCVPAEPQRVITLDPGSLGNTLALGIQPIGAATLDAQLPDYLQERVSDLELLGHPNQPSLEKITLLKPDLILTDTRTDLYQRLSEIAPTVASEDWIEPESEPLWKRDLKLHIQAVGQIEQGEQLLSDYDRRIQDFQQQMGDRLSNTQISVVNFRPDHVRIYLKDSFVGTILKDAGLPRPPAQDQAGFIERISLEAIPQLDADVMFLIVSDPEQTSTLDQFTQSPLWSQLNVVQQNRVYPVSSDVWINGWHMLGAQQVLDDLFQYLISETAGA